MKGNLFSKTLGLSLAIALVLTPVVNLAVVRDNVGGMDTSVSQEGNTPNGGATEDQILEGYGAYVDGVLIEGNIPTANVADTIINDLNDSVTIPGHTYIDENLTIGLSSTFLKDATNGATATANKMLQGETAYVDGELVTGTIPSLAAKTYTPGTTNQTIASGKYLSGTQTILGDADLVSNNIKSGVNIFGVTGNSNVVDTSAGTATAAQILKDKVAYVDGSKVTGFMTNNAGTTKTATTVTESGDNALIAIPSAGYYDANSKISVPVEILKKNVTSITENMIDIATADFQTVGTYTKNWSGQTGINGNDTDYEARSGSYTFVAYTNNTDSPQLVSLAIQYWNVTGHNVSCEAIYPTTSPSSGGTGILKAGESVEIRHVMNAICSPNSSSPIAGKITYTVTLFS